METDLEKYLQMLNSERCLEKPKEAAFVISKISQCFEEEQSQFKLSLLLALILDENDALFTFIWKSCSNYETVSSIAAAFKLLDFLVATFEKLSLPYFPILFEKCLNLLDGKFAKVRELSLKLIKKLITCGSRVNFDLEKLISKLEKNLAEDSKIPGTVAEQIFVVLGFLFEKYPESVSKKEKWFFKKIYESLKREITVVKNPSNSKIRGAFEGIDGYLVNYTPADSETLKKIYVFVRNFSKFRVEKRLASRAALKVFQNHWKHFLEAIFKDRSIWRSNLLAWLNQSSEDRLAGLSALSSLYNVISFKITTDGGNNEVLKSYVKDFKETLSSEHSNSFEKKSALIGIKFFVLNEELQGDEFNETYDFLMEFLKKQNSFGNFFYLPLCIECVSAFVLRFSTKDSFSAEQLSCLQRLSVALIDEYPKIDPLLQPNALASLEKSFYTLGLCSLRVVEDHIDKVLYQGLVRSCSHMTWVEIDHLKEKGELEAGSLSYKSYLSLWRYFLNLINSSNLPLDGSFALKKGIAVKVFDVIMESLIKIVSKLNLTVNVKEKGSDMEAEVEKPSDLTIFVNCVDVYQSLIPKVDSYNFSKWVVKILHQMVNLSYENPLVAGFYKIIATTFTAADDLQFFELNGNTESFSLVEKYLENVLKKIDHYKGELQIACLRTLLAAPVQLVESFVEKTVPALIAAVKLARNDFTLLGDLVETLERWDFGLPASSMNILVQAILPHFDLFFQSQYFQGNNLVDSSIEGKKLKKKLVVSDSELLSLQKRFLMFLGSLDLNKALNMIKVSSGADEERKLSDKNLVYRPPADVRGFVEINLDDILPRVMELATSCSDRRTRITACELLYSGAMIILSNVNQLSGGYTGLFRKMIKTCLVLGCDSDCVVYQIFEPLMFQIVHYFSEKKAVHFSETQDLIEILIDFVSLPYEPAVRDFSAVLISEFTIWSIRHLTLEELKVTPDSVKKILNNVYSLSLHPSYNKRLGAAVVFNKIYSVLREEEAILDGNWFQLVYYLVENLGMCDKEENTKEIEEAIVHVKRPLVERCDLFNNASERRNVPPEFEGGLLCHLIKWVLKRCSHPKPSVRRVAMNLVEDLAPLVQNCDSLSSFFKNHCNREVYQVEKRPFDFSNASQEDFVGWVNRQSASFEYFAWLLDHGLLTPKNVFSFGFDEVSKNYTTAIASQQGKTFQVEECKRDSVFLFIKLLSSLKEGAFYFSSETWEFLRIAVFRPSEYGFNLNVRPVSKKLSSALSTLLEYLSVRLTQYNWNLFYKNLETLIVVPVLHYITKNRYVDVKNLEFLFALQVIEGSKIWGEFIKRTSFSMHGGLIVEIIFRSLFLKQSGKIVTVPLEPSCKLYLEELMILGSKVGGGLEEIFEFIEDTTEVWEEETCKTVTKGEYFLLLFKSITFEMLSNQYSLLVEKVLQKATLGALNLLIQSLEHRKPENGETSLPLEILRRWEDFEAIKLPGVSPRERKKVLFHLAASSARVIASPGCLKATPVATLVYSYFENNNFQESDVEEMESCFALLPFLSNLQEKEEENCALGNTLFKFFGDQEALKNSLGRSGAKARPLEVVIDCLLKSLKFSGSLAVLQYILTMAPLMESFFQKEAVESALCIFETLPEAHCISALEIIYHACFKNEKINSFVMIVYKWFMSPLMKLASTAALCQIVVQKLESLFSLITSHWADDGRSTAAIRIEFLRRTCAADMLQIFVSKLSSDDMAKIPEDKKLLLNRVIQKSFSLLRGSRPNIALKERYRKFMCEVFNMICCIVSSRSTDPKIYKLFLFDERGSFLCEAVDKTFKYDLDMDFDEVPKRRKILTRLQKVAKDIGSNSGRFTDSIRYVQTNTLFSSSLREDVTQFDLTYSPIRPLNSIRGQEDAQKGMEIELEVDSFNSHECMPTLVGVISKMMQDKIIPETETELPSWLKFFLNVLEGANFSANLKLFVLKAMYNVQDFVKPFCKEVFPQVLNFVVNFFSSYPINYFLVDLIEMMMGWNYVPESFQSREQLTNLVKSVIFKSDSLRRDIVKSNLEIVRTMIEVWKNVLLKEELSTFVYERLAESVQEDTASNRSGSDSVTYLNVKISGIFLANNIPPWIKDSEKTFIGLLLKNFNEGNRNLQVFAEICGLALANLKDSSSPVFEECEGMVCKRVSEADSWLPLLCGIHKHYPEISSKFVFKIFSSSWSSMDSLTADKLEMLLSHVSRSESFMNDTFERHVHSFLMDMLNSVDVSVQKFSLQIASKLLDTLEENKLAFLVKEVFRLQRSVHPEVRKWVYEISVRYYRRNTGENDLMKQCKVVLLKGLNDSESEMENFCLTFWRTFFETSSPHLLLVKALREMYMPEVEDIFLSNLIKVLLDFSVNLNEFKKPIFLHPIHHQSRFRKRTLFLGSRSTFLPGFMSSRVSTNQSLEHVATLKSRNTVYSRSMASSLKFEPTMQETAEDIVVSETETQTESTTPKNPFRRRFYKSTQKSNFSFARWRAERMKKKKEKEEDMSRKKEAQVDIFGEYREGDYPDIEISHSQILKPLEALAKRDHQIARRFLVSFYSGLVESLRSDEKAILISETNETFERILNSSTSFDPAVIGFVLHILLKFCKDFDVGCEKVTNAAVSSNWIPVGALIIEQMIAKNNDAVIETAKKSRGCSDYEEVIWLELARLYRSLEEYDVFSGILLDKVDVPEDGKKAVRLEALSDWSTASKSYESALKTDPNSRRCEFFTQSYFLCLAKLSNWSLLDECIRTTVDNDLDGLWKNYNLLSWFLKSETMVSLRTGKNDFQSALNEFCRSKSKSTVLNSNFGEELAVFDWLSGKVQRASYRIDRLCLDFLAGWSHLNRWSYNLRAAKLAELQTISELGFAVKALAEGSRSELEHELKVSKQRWEKTMPCSRDDLTVWDFKLSYRRQFFRQVKDHCLISFEMKSNLALAKAALVQENLSLAKEYLSRVKEQLPDADFDIKAEYDYCFNLGKMIVAKLKLNDGSDGLNMYLNVWQGISKEVSSSMDTDSEISRIHTFRCNFVLGQLVSTILPVVISQNVSSGCLKALGKKLDTQESKPLVIEALKKKGLEYLESAKTLSETADFCVSAKSDTYLELTKYLLKFSDMTRFSEFEKLSKYLLKAMSLGNLKARELFGCMMNLSHLVVDNGSFEALVAESNLVPSWMFLTWISQILANIESEIFSFLKNILLRIAQDYPNALRYPFMLARDRFERGTPCTKTLSENLSKLLLNNIIYENFVNSMKYLAQPDLILRHHLEKALVEVDQKKPDLRQAKAHIETLNRVMFSTEYDKFRGPVFSWWEKFRPGIESLLKSKEENETLMKIKEMLVSIENFKMPSKRALGFLESYCPWLQNFHCLKEDVALELPGQYDFNYRPRTQHLVTVSSFKNDVLVFNSKCRPIRISILGNDAAEHKFLIKFGEDLRQDERIQQVFRHFNYKLKENKQTLRFSIDTYKVTPLTFSLGMIEWIENNVSLLEIIENTLGNDVDTIARAQSDHLKFLAHGSSLGPIGSIKGTITAHLAAYDTLSRDIAITTFNARTHQFPEDLLKKSFLNLSTSPEHFIHLRGNFAVSYAVTCITHWLVGIGDRHLQNILVSTKTGRVLGIDFGYAFGFATHFLTPPELVPFRLTPQILNLMQPFGESGWIKQTMIHCLRAFRKEHLGLLSILEVFALEPVMDWLEQARKSPRCKMEGSENWYPKQKISMVQRKLNGTNPVTVFEADLVAGNSGSKYLHKYLEVLQGIERDNIRARCAREGLTEEEQVECLIDLATDRHVLAKTFVGWNPWL